MSIFSRIFGKGDGDGDGMSGDDGGPGTVKCPTCGTRSAADAAFCGECGATLRAEPPRVTTSRKAPAPHQAPPQSNARPPIPAQTANTLHQPTSRDGRGTAPVVASRGAPQRKKSSRPPQAAAAPSAGQEPAPLTLEPISDRPPVASPPQPVGLPPPPPARNQKAKAPAKPPPKPTRSPSTENLDRMLEEFDVGFDAALSTVPQPTEPAAPPRAEDVAAARELFEAIAASYVRPVRSFVMELKWCDAPASWLEVCLPTLRAVRGSADKLGLAELVSGIDSLHAELSSLGQAKDAAGATEAKQRVASAYAKLCLVAPNLFGVEDERNRREPMIVQALLKQVPAVRQLEMERIYGSGLSTLDSLFLATPEDLAATAGLAIEVARQVVAVFQTYKSQLRGDAFAAEQATLRTLVDRLKKEQEEYERASSSWTEQAKDAKKRLRKDRAATAQRINVVLARIGELDRVNQLEKATFAQKISGLEAYLEQSKRASLP